MYLTAEGKATIYPEDESYAQAFLRNMHEDLNDIKRSFIKIGFRLVEANENEYYKELGYQNIVELAEAEFGFKSSTTYEFMKVYELAHDRDCRWHIAQKYDKFSYSQLLALTYAKYTGAAFWRIVQPTDSVRNLKRFVSNWNKEYKTGCGYHPELKTVDDYLKAYDAKHAEEPKQISEYTGQLPGQIALELSGPEEPEEEFSERSEKFESENAVQEETVAPMTDGELIEYVLKQGGPYMDSKFRIVDFYNSQPCPTQQQFKNYVMNDYGSGYRTGDKNYKRVEYSGNLTIMRLNGGKIVLTWAVVAGNISRMITADKYLSDEEKEEHLQWKALRQKLTKAEPQQEQTEPAEDFSERSEKSENEEIPQPPKREYLASVKKETIERLMVAMVTEHCDMESVSVSKIEDELREQTNRKFYSYHFSDLAEFIIESDVPEDKYTETYCGVLALLGVGVTE